MALPILQVVVPSYSERWFDLKSRTTATMIMSLGKSVDAFCYALAKVPLQQILSGML